MSGADVIRTRIWHEEPEADDAFTAAVCRAHGYDVFGELVGRASFTEYLFLLFRGERPTPAETALLDALAVALGNPGPRDPAVNAAMAGGAGGSSAAACLMAALAVGAGTGNGARSVHDAMVLWQQCGTDGDAWREALRAPAEGPVDVWPDAGRPPGFEAHAHAAARPVRQALAGLAALRPGGALAWLEANRTTLEATAGRPLAMAGVAAAGFADLGFSPAQGEMLALFLRLPGAAVHALEQADGGWRGYPFFRDGLVLRETADPERTHS